ncbi:cell division protein FtsB [Neptunomonas japonica]|uniref:Cell division protein FtsB n=1 Tax=Neptunomonas japonica JAMM 1380 TaxID=1441457 RepID=A0A7R6P7A0_9GAMM|nr:cell division protein FtsB [Neptunomonas japonica]BBB28549.1 cell division protein FtsB [Neptunomonas japonica JAMM 1380]
MFRWFIALLLLILLGLQYRLWFGDANIFHILDLQEKIAVQVDENERLQMRNRQLEAEVTDLKKGLSAIEERARSDQGMVREGETFYQLVEPSVEAIEN